MMNVCAGSSTEPSVVVSSGAFGSTVGVVGGEIWMTDQVPCLNVAVTAPAVAKRAGDRVADVPRVDEHRSDALVDGHGAEARAAERELVEVGERRADELEAGRDARERHDDRDRAQVDDERRVAVDERAERDHRRRLARERRVDESIHDQLPAMKVMITSPAWSGWVRK